MNKHVLKKFLNLALAALMLLGTATVFTGCNEAIPGPKGDTGAQGAAGANGTDGADGAAWLTGNTAPDAAQGNEGDMYLNSADFNLYQKANGAWTLIGNLKGADGQKGEAGKDGKNGADGDTSKEVVSSMEYFHISFDDTKTCFADLTNKKDTYTSMYENEFLGWLKELHDTYDAKFSLYAFLDDLATVTDAFADEFYAAKDWLKIGLHAPNYDENYSMATYEKGKNDWNTFVDRVVHITGSYLSIDRMPRLHNFAGSIDALQGMRDANCGALGFLAADDTRNSYYFNSESSNWLYNHDHVTDYENGLTFLTTDIRAEWFRDSSSSVSKATAYDELVYRYTTASYANKASSFIFFTHEGRFYEAWKEGVKTAIEDACRFAEDYNIPMDFPQNRVYAPTQYDVHP